MIDLINLKLPLVLASQSPRRSKLLTQISLNFDVIHSSIDESEHPLHIDPVDYAGQLSLKKALEVASRVDYPAIVLGADTIVCLDNTILNKPIDAADAQRMLNMLSGNTHIVYTGVSLVESSTGKSTTEVKATKVTFRKLAKHEIEAYVAGGSPLDKAGAYGIQDDMGAVFISHIEGCYYNIVGLPLEMLYSMLNKFNNEISTPSRETL